MRSTSMTAMDRVTADDQADVRAAVAGDAEARARLVERHGPVVWSLCRRLDPEPEDAYQEVWLKALPALGRFDPLGRATLRTWLQSITHRHLVDRHRRRAVRQRDLPAEIHHQPALAPDDGAAALQQRHQLEGALAALPDGLRRVVVMHHLHGRDLIDIAEAEQLAIGTVKSRLHRGRARLAQLLGGPR